MKILITGGKGQLGSDCTRIFQKDHEVISWDIDEIDITVYPDVEKMVGNLLPDIIVNCAAYTQVDNCETERDLAWNVNVKGPENLARSAKEYGRPLIHISTDYVFDGMKEPPEPYAEDDPPNPLSFYGITKLEGEKAIRRTIDRHIIVRTAWLYGASGHNFLKTMLKLALKNPDAEVKVVDDQYGSPTWSYRLALQLAELAGKRAWGTYHATAEGYCSWYELAGRFLEYMGVPHKLIGCTSEEYPLPAKRPQNSILENRQLKQKHMNMMVAWQEDLKQFVLENKERLIRACQS